MLNENVLDLPDNDNRRRSIRRDTTQNDYPKQSHRVAPNYVSEWRSVSEDTDSRPNPLPIFSGSCGLKFPMPANPEDFVFLVIDREFCETIATWCNHKAELNNDLRRKETKFGNRSHTKQ